MIKRNVQMARGASTLKRSGIAAGGAQLARAEMSRGTAELRTTATLKRTEMGRGTTGLRASAPIDSGSIDLYKLAPVQMDALAGAAVRSWGRTKRMKQSRAKSTPIRKSAEGEACTLLYPGICCHDPLTTVWCHSNLHSDGKGMGIKADDEAGAYGCFACHAFYDGGWAAFAHWTRDMAQQYFEKARAISRVILDRKGLLAA